MSLLIILIKILVLSCSAIDLAMTAIYIKSYLKYQPNMKIDRIEKNILIRKLIKKWGLDAGLIWSSVFIWLLVYFIVLITNWMIWIAFIIIYSYTIFNHTKNMKILKRLKEKFPKGFKEIKTKKGMRLVSK